MNASVSDVPGQLRLSPYVWVRWVALSVAVASIVGVIPTLLAYTSEAFKEFWMDISFMCLSMPVAGLAISTAQWIILRASIPKPRIWLILSCLGWIGGYAIGMVVGGVIGFVMDPQGAIGPVTAAFYPGPRGMIIGSPFVGATTGFILGFMQMIALEGGGRDPGRGWGFWPIVNAAGWGLGFLAAFLFAANVGARGEELHPLAVAGSFLVCAAVSAAVAGGALGFVLNAPLRERRIHS